MQLYKTVSGNPLTATTTDSGQFDTITYPLTVANDEAHTGMGFRFLGDGVSNTSTLADGVYLLSLKVSTAGLADSDPFYFVLPKGVSPEEAGQATLTFAAQQGIARDAVQTMAAIPEPASLTLAAAAISGCVAARRRQRSNNEA
jgi:hypothetical protein